MTAPFRLQPFAEHDRTTFECGEPALDGYFRTQVTQDIRRRLANCLVAIEGATGAGAAYYTLSAASIPINDLPAELMKRLPRYPTIPAVRMGRLAVDQRFHGRGLGGALLADAVHRALQAPAAAYALLVDAKNDKAVRFYEHHGFRAFSSAPMTLFLPLETARKALSKFPAAP